jgi:hypothetical protein
VGVALNNGQALPPAGLLDRAQVYPSHDQPGGESVPVVMPRVRVQVPPGLRCRFPSPSTLGSCRGHCSRRSRATHPAGLMNSPGTLPLTIPRTNPTSSKPKPLLLDWHGRPIF